MSIDTLQEMESVLKLQKKLHIEEGPASIELRKDRLNRCISMLKEYSSLNRRQVNPQAFPDQR